MDRIPLLTEILAQNPTDAFARYGLAMAYAEANQPEEALTHFATLRTGNPYYVPAYQMAAQLLLRLNRPEEARDCLTHGLKPLPAPATPTPSRKCKPPRRPRLSART